MSHLFYQKECSSTNDEISEVLLYPNLNFIGLYTFNQTKGRGQYGNRWLIQPGKNLAYTLAVCSSDIGISDFMFSYYTAFAVREFLASLTHKDIKIKWPNDIILQNKKVAGILIEKKKVNTETYFIIGIGINVLQEQFEAISNAGSLLSQTGNRYDLTATAEKLHEYLTDQLNLIPSENEIMNLFNAHLFRKDAISVFEISGYRQNGIIRHAGKEGEITVELETGIRYFYHKELKLLY